MSEQLKFGLFERELINPLHGHELTVLETYIAGLLLDASSERPIDNESIRACVHRAIGQQITSRTVKSVIRDLRRNHHFPIISRRKPPGGYWWCSSPSEMNEYIRTFRSQAVDELHTLSLIVRANYPELAGQLVLEDL